MAERSWSSYATAEAFRDALEDRLNQEAKQRAMTVDRLRKEAAFHRLMARVVAAGSPRWALKGGFALIIRLGRHVRATRDLDANWRATRHDLDGLLGEVEQVDLGDWFRFEFGEPQPMDGEVPGQVALRYPVTCYLGDREFERTRLDVNLVGENDPRPVEPVLVGRNPFAFVGAATLEVPMITPAHQLAEKLHAYVRDYPDGRSSRPKDLYDSLLIANEVPLPAAGSLIQAATETFAVRHAAWPPTLHPPPQEWQREWSALVSDSNEPLVGNISLDEAFARWGLFWRPLLDPVTNDGAQWSSDDWSWTGV